MQIGMWIDDERPLAAVVESVEEAANLGFARVWFGQRAGWDALTLITAVGSRVPGIRLGTAVVLTWPQHPLAPAGQALSANAAVEGRLTLGIGPSHQPIVDGLAEHSVPAVHAAAAGRAAPQVVVGVVASVTHDPDAAREYVANRFGVASELPSYRRSTDREGFAGPGDTVLAGDEAELEKAVRGFADAGATEFQPCAVGPEGDRARTVAFFGELARQLRA